MPAANLEVTSVNGTPAVVAPGGSLAITDTTANTGYVSVGEPSTTRFYLSTDDVITPADIRIGERVVPNIAGGRADRTTTSIVIPAGVPPGTYFIGACADGPGVIFESNESDNCTASSERVRIVERAVAPSAPTESGAIQGGRDHAPARRRVDQPGLGRPAFGDERCQPHRLARPGGRGSSPSTPPSTAAACTREPPWHRRARPFQAA